jgi:hypothetical protein
MTLEKNKKIKSLLSDKPQIDLMSSRNNKITSLRACEFE